VTTYTLHESLDTNWRRLLTRVLLVGPPNSGKTTSLRTFPTPLIVQSYPGEKGTTSIPYAEGVKAFIGELPQPGDPVNYGQIIRETESQTTEILTGKHGPCQTFAGDGLHKLYAIYLAEATAGASADGKDFEARLYGSAHRRFFKYLDMVCRSAVPHVVFTCWDGREKDDPDEGGSSPSRHIFPELPGQAAKAVMGEFALVLYATRQGSGPAAKYLWQTQPMGKVWGAGAKLPLEIAKRLPLTVEQDWARVAQIIIEEGVR